MIPALLGIMAQPFNSCSGVVKILKRMNSEMEGMRQNNQIPKYNENSEKNEQ